MVATKPTFERYVMTLETILESLPEPSHEDVREDERFNAWDEDGNCSDVDFFLEAMASRRDAR